MAPAAPVRGLDDTYLARGLTGACRALEGGVYEFGGGTSPPWFMAHFGLAVMAGVWITREFDVDRDTVAAIGAQCDDVIEAFPALFEPMDLTDGEASPGRVDDLVAELRLGLHRYIRAGHNVTYTAYLTKALREHPEWTTPGVLERLRALIATVNSPLEREDGPLPSQQATPRYRRIEDVAVAIFRDIDALDFDTFEAWTISVGHVLTHGHGLLELARLGYGDVARLGFDAHRAHALLARTDRARTQRMDKIVHDRNPLTADFWRGDVRTDRDWEAGHSFKYTYSLHRTCRWVEDEGLCRRAARQLWYMV